MRGQQTATNQKEFHDIRIRLQRVRFVRTPWQIEHRARHIEKNETFFINYDL